MKKLKILLTINHLEYFLGSELFLFTVVEDLRERGYEVSVFAYLSGIMMQAFEHMGIEVVNKIEDKYDMTIVNHNSTLIQSPKSAYKIFVSHGPFVDLEQPILGADKYISISEEVYQNLYSKGFYSSILYNPVNLKKYKSQRPINGNLENILLLSNKLVPTDNEFKVINEACSRLGLRLTPIGLGFGTSQWETEEWINNSDLVISMGRGIYESMACERNVIVAGYGNLVGFIDKKTYPKFLKTNCSGRGSQELITVDGLIREFKKYNPEQGKINRELAKKNHDVKKFVDKILNFYFYRKYV